MATLSGQLYADNATLKRTEPATALDVTLNYGKIRYISDSYTCPTADEFGTSAVINFFKIPKGARVLEMMITAPVDGGSPATGQFDVGWLASVETDANGTVLEAADADGFYVSTVADVGAGALARLQVAATRPGYRKKFAAEVQVQADCAEATLDYGTKVILLEAYIVIE
jgi:hypothetical protein